MQATGTAQAIKLIVTIVGRGEGRAIAQVYNAAQVTWHYQCAGEGTASSDLLGVLGFGGPERDVLLSLGAASSVDRMMERLQEYPEDSGAQGIAVSMKVDGINNIVATILTRQSQTITDNGGTRMDSMTDDHMILIIAEHGHTEEIMNTARAAGARGGTILRSRYAGAEENDKFFGITIQGEKEIILIVSPSDVRNAIMETVNLKHGLKTEAGAVIFSVPLDHMVRFSGD